MKYLSIEGLSKIYEKGNLALSDFSLDINKGSIWSLVGESGSGKSTLLRIIAGLETQSQGAVYLEGERVLNPTEKLVAGHDEIRLVHQQKNFYPHSTVEENIARPLLQYDNRYKTERVELMLEMLGFHAHRHKLPRHLSGGQQQKLAIGIALSTEPAIMLLDEPFSGLDPIQKRQLMEVLREVFDKLQMTVLVVTHDMEDALSLTERLAIIKGGRLIQKGKPQQIHEKPINEHVARLFSDLNPLPDVSKAFIRPQDIVVGKTPGGMKGKISSVQYLAGYNELTVLLQDSGMKWKAEDRERKYLKEDLVYLAYDREKILQF